MGKNKKKGRGGQQQPAAGGGDGGVAPQAPAARPEVSANQTSTVQEDIRAVEKSSQKLGVNEVKKCEVNQDVEVLKEELGPEEPMQGTFEEQKSSKKKKKKQQQQQQGQVEVSKETRGPGPQQQQRGQVEVSKETRGPGPQPKAAGQDGGEDKAGQVDRKALKEKQQPEVAQEVTGSKKTKKKQQQSQVEVSKETRGPGPQPKAAGQDGGEDEAGQVERKALKEKQQPEVAQEVTGSKKNKKKQRQAKENNGPEQHPDTPEGRVVQKGSLPGTVEQQKGSKKNNGDGAQPKVLKELEKDSTPQEPPVQCHMLVPAVAQPGAILAAPQSPGQGQVQLQLNKTPETNNQEVIPGPTSGAGDQVIAEGTDPNALWIETAKERMIYETEFPVKPTAGTMGRPVNVEVNHFPIKVMGGNKRILMYDVTMKPIPDPKSKNQTPDQIKSKKTCRGIWAGFTAKYESVLNGVIAAYDGYKIAYAVEPGLPDTESEISFMEDGFDTPRRYTVTVKRAGKEVLELIDILNYASGRTKDPPLRVISAVNAFFAHVPSFLHLNIGRRFLYDDYQDDLTGGKIARYGFTMSVREGDKPGWTLHLSVNSVAGVLAKAGNAADIAAELFGCRSPADIMLRRNFISVRRELDDHFRYLRVKTTHNRRTKAVTAVSKKPAREIMFVNGVGPKAKQLSLVEYYWKNYKIQLKYQDLPCFNFGPVQNNTFIPIELCEVLPNQSRLNQLSERQTTLLLNAMTMTPEKRFGYITQDVARFAKDSAPLLKQLGMEINTTLQQIPGRVIPAPDITYRQNQVAKPNVGSWRADRMKFLISPGGGVAWGYSWASNCGLEMEEVASFAKNLVVSAKSCGLDLGVPINVGPLKTPHDLLNAKVQKLALLLVVLPESKSNPGGFREDVKRIAETKQYGFGLMTQCVKPQHFRGVHGRTPAAFTPMFTYNLLLKINTKLGGINSAPKMDPICLNFVKSSGTLILGADVSHSPPGSKHPSVAAILGSVDRAGLQYSAHIRVQDVCEEFIQEMRDVMINCLLNYYKKNGQRKPERIIYYRDGLGEGAFKKVRSYEIAKMQEACRALEPGYEPLISLVIVQKRHQTRFKPADNENCTRSQNVLPGTVIDRTITSARLFDFYLVSHEGIKGTSKPTHYWLVWDDNRFSQNGLQALTNYLCYGYSRCNRAVSIPAPTYYAHHVAFRAKGYIKDRFNNENMTVSSGNSDSIDLVALNEAVKLHVAIENKMFFV